MALRGQGQAANRLQAMGDQTRPDPSDRYPNRTQRRRDDKPGDGDARLGMLDQAHVRRLAPEPRRAAEATTVAEHERTRARHVGARVRAGQRARERRNAARRRHCHAGRADRLRSRVRRDSTAAAPANGRSQHPGRKHSLRTAHGRAYKHLDERTLRACGDARAYRLRIGESLLPRTTTSPDGSQPCRDSAATRHPIRATHATMA